MMEPVVLDRTHYVDLIEQMLKKRSNYTDQWDSALKSDPGVTLLQLMSLLTDLQGYHADSVTERHRMAYIRLLGLMAKHQKCTIIRFPGMDGQRFLKESPIAINGHVFEYQDSIGEDCRFVQKETVVGCWQINVKGINSNLFLNCYHAVHGKIHVFRRSGKDDLWRRYSAAEIKRRPHGVFIHFGEHPGVYRVLYNIRAPFFAVSDGTPSQSIILPSGNILPQAFKIWVGDGDCFRDIGHHFKSGAIVLGDGSDFPIPEKGKLIQPYHMILSDGAVEISKKSHIDKKNLLSIHFPSPVIERTGAPSETAEQALFRFKNIDRIRKSRLVTAQDYRETTQILTGLSPEKIRVEQTGAVVEIFLFEPCPMESDALLQKLKPYRMINQNIKVHMPVPTTVRVSGAIKLLNDNPANREKIKETLEQTLLKIMGELSYSALNRALLSLPFVQNSDVSAEWDSPQIENSKSVLFPDLDMGEVIYE
ncbi:MAG: hypothetical protein LBR74_01595 [Eubacterium sp.]|jgi:hypothetical protein|nr:hypothetical protein [Eubacterium sp.]